jgi:hypothetical protein
MAFGKISLCSRWLSRNFSSNVDCLLRMLLSQNEPSANYTPPDHNRLLPFDKWQFHLHSLDKHTNRKNNFKLGHSLHFLVVS